MKTLLFVVLTFLSASNFAHSRTWDEIKKSGTIRIAADGATAPFNYYKEEKLVGFEIDLAEHFAKQLGLKVEWKVQPFTTLLVSLDQNKFDLIATSHAINPQREKIVDFAIPHYCTGAMIVSKKKGPKTLKELKGKTVAVPVGTVYFDELKKHPEIGEVKTVPSESDALQALLADKADAFVTEQFVAFEAVDKQKSKGLVLGDRISDQSNAMVVSKGNKELLDKINEQVKKALKDGTYKKLSTEYFKRDIRCK